MIFHDRAHAGRLLAARLEHLRAEQPVVLALPRGGVPVAREIALALDAPLDVIIVRKLGAPDQPELGLGAIGEHDVRVLNPAVVAATAATPTEIGAVEARERVEIERRRARYREGREMISVRGRTVIVVDDGIATGGSARAALRVARALGASRVVLAVPVAPPSSLAELEPDTDEIVVLDAPPHLVAVGGWYHDFRQLADDDVVRLLDRSGPPEAPGSGTIRA